MNAPERVSMLAVAWLRGVCSTVSRGRYKRPRRVGSPLRRVAIVLIAVERTTCALAHEVTRKVPWHDLIKEKLDEPLFHRQGQVRECYLGDVRRSFNLTHCYIA